MSRRRRRKRAADARPVFAFPTDALRESGQPREAEPDPEVERKRKLRGRVRNTLLLTVFAAGLLGAIFAKGGLVDRMRLTQELRAVEAQVDAQRQRVEALRRQVRRLNDDPMARERIAREQLGYAKPGEIVFLLPKEQGSPRLSREGAEDSGEPADSASEDR